MFCWFDILRPCKSHNRCKHWWHHLTLQTLPTQVSRNIYQKYFLKMFILVLLLKFTGSEMGNLILISQVVENLYCTMCLQMMQVKLWLDLECFTASLIRNLRLSWWREYPVSCRSVDINSCAIHSRVQLCSAQSRGRLKLSQVS